jgi:hypothetical protein
MARRSRHTTLRNVALSQGCNEEGYALVMLGSKMPVKRMATQLA